MTGIQYLYSYFSRIIEAYANEDLAHNPRRIFDMAADFARMNRDFDSHPLCLRLSQPVIKRYCSLWEATQKPATP